MGIVRTGIWTLFRASAATPLYLDLDGARLYYSEALEETSFPYCVFHVFDEIYDYTFDLEFENVGIQFDYYGTTADQVDDGIADIKTMFDYCTLTLTGYTCLRMERELVFNPVKIQPYDIWQGTVRYSLLIQKD